MIWLSIWRPKGVFGGRSMKNRCKRQMEGCEWGKVNIRSMCMVCVLYFRAQIWVVVNGEV